MKRTMAFVTALVFSLSIFTINYNVSANENTEYKDWLIQQNDIKNRRYDPKQVSDMWETFYKYINGDYDTPEKEKPHVNNSAQLVASGLGDLYNCVSCNNNLFYIDYNNNVVKKYNFNNKKIETLVSPSESFSILGKVNNVKRLYNGSNFQFTKITCDKETGKVYAAGNYVDKNHIFVKGEDDNSYVSAVWEVYPEIKIATSVNHRFKTHTNYTCYIKWTDFLSINNNDIYFSDRFGTMFSNLCHAKVGQLKANVVGQSIWNENKNESMLKLMGCSDAIVKNDFIYIYDAGTQGIGHYVRIDRQSGEVQKLIELKGFPIGITHNGDNFYYIADGNIYKFGLNGKTEVYASIDNLQAKGLYFNNNQLYIFNSKGEIYKIVK